jgi:hypothetical protein
MQTSNKDTISYIKGHKNKILFLRLVDSPNEVYQRYFGVLIQLLLGTLKQEGISVIVRLC